MPFPRASAAFCSISTPLAQPPSASTTRASAPGSHQQPLGRDGQRRLCNPARVRAAVLKRAACRPGAMKSFAAPHPAPCASSEVWLVEAQGPRPGLGIGDRVVCEAAGQKGRLLLGGMASRQGWASPVRYHRRRRSLRRARCAVTSAEHTA